eukprot:1695099-Rhodomonas_salina.2
MERRSANSIRVGTHPVRTDTASTSADTRQGADLFERRELARLHIAGGDRLMRTQLAPMVSDNASRRRARRRSCRCNLREEGQIHPAVVHVGLLRRLRAIVDERRACRRHAPLMLQRAVRSSVACADGESVRRRGKGRGLGCARKGDRSGERGRWESVWRGAETGRKEGVGRGSG